MQRGAAFGGGGERHRADVEAAESRVAPRAQEAQETAGAAADVAYRRIVRDAGALQRLKRRAVTRLVPPVAVLDPRQAREVLGGQRVDDGRVAHGDGRRLAGTSAMRTSFTSDTPS